MWIVTGLLLTALTAYPGNIEARLTPGARIALAPGADAHAQLLGLLEMEESGVARYGAVAKFLAAEGVTTAEQRAALRAAAQAGVLTPAERQRLSRVSALLRRRLQWLGAGRETLAALERYGPQADILRLGYLERMAEAEARVLPPEGEVGQILAGHGVTRPADRAALRALPFGALGARQQRAVVALRRYWQAQLRAAGGGPVWMHKELPARWAPAVLAGRPTLRAGSYWTYHKAVRDLRTPAEAYDRMALGYQGTAFAPDAAERYWLLLPASRAMVRNFGVPMAGEMVLASDLPTGPVAVAFPSAMNGFTASLTGFVPEWTWTGPERPYPDGTRLLRRDRNGRVQTVATVMDGAWK